MRLAVLRVPSRARDLLLQDGVRDLLARNVAARVPLDLSGGLLRGELPLAPASVDRRVHRGALTRAPCARAAASTPRVLLGLCGPPTA